jgi:predicted kinase
VTAGHRNPEGSENPGTGDPRGVDLVVFVGLQASGKSTFFRERFAATHEHVSKDLFPNNKNRNRRQAQLIEASLSAGSPVVVDNTNPTPEDRRALVELGGAYGARIVCYYFESGVRPCLERNRRREGKARVPDVAIYATAKRLVAPSYSEGFDELFRVRMAGNAFEVEPYAGRELATQQDDRGRFG